MRRAMIYRQGDVLIKAVDNVPADTKPVPRENGKVVLAHGEVTGHAHTIVEEAAELVTAEQANELFLLVHGAEPVAAIECRNLQGDIVYIPRGYDPGAYSPPLTRIGDVEVKGVTVVHDEHLPYVLPEADYSITRQREYQPDAPRQVLD